VNHETLASIFLREIIVSEFPENEHIQVLLLKIKGNVIPPVLGSSEQKFSKLRSVCFRLSRINFCLRKVETLTNPGACHPVVHRQVNQVVEEACGQLARESWRLPLHEAAEADSPQLLVGRGGRLLDILVGSEFNEVVVLSSASTRDDFLRYAGAAQMPGFTDKFDVRKTGFTVLQFSSAEAAQSALRSLKEEAPNYMINDRDIGPWRVITGGRSSQLAAFELRVNVERRKNQAMAFIRFRTEGEAAAAALKLSGTVLFVKTERLVSENLVVKPNKRDDKKSLFCWLQDRGSLRVKDVTEHRILEAMQERGLNPEGVRIPKEKEYESSREEQENVKQAIRDVFTNSRICSQADFCIDLKRPLAKDFTWVAWIRFQSSATGLKCALYCEVKKIGTIPDVKDRE